jgi:hypothetical protein
MGLLHRQPKVEDPAVAIGKMERAETEKRIAMALAEAKAFTEDAVNEALGPSYARHQVVLTPSPDEAAKSLMTSRKAAIQMNLAPANSHDQDKSKPERYMDKAEDLFDKLSNTKTLAKAVVGGTVISSLVLVLNEVERKYLEMASNSIDISLAAMFGIGLAANIVRNWDEVKGAAKGKVLVNGVKAKAAIVNGGKSVEGTMAHEGKLIEGLALKDEKKAVEEIKKLRRVRKVIGAAISLR